MYFRFVPRRITTRIRGLLTRIYIKIKLIILSLFYNYYMDQSYITDTLMEPMFWFVDNFTRFLGPFFVAAVCALTSFVIGVAYIIGLPYWWNRNQFVTFIALIIGHWLLLNVSFHFYKACMISPGQPPQGKLITEAVSICKKCISPKPPRTHHCSICDRCVLKMDHHCPWLNNCVGHYNHRHFFMYMTYMVIGCFYLMVFGIELAYQEIFGGIFEIHEENLIEGYPVRINNSKIIPVQEMMHNGSFYPLPMIDAEEVKARNWPRTCLIFVALIVGGVFIALGSLTLWHARLITRGETSIESHINYAETKRLGRPYDNPYNFGKKKNWKLFLGLNNGRNWMHILLPSSHPPTGNGLTWTTVTSLEDLKIFSEKIK